MKNVRLSLGVLLAILVFFTACQKEEFDFDNQFEDTELIDGSGDDGTFDDGNDGGAGDLALLTTYQISGDNITKVKDHNVANNMLSFQKDVQKHQAMWSYYTQLIPAKYRGKNISLLFLQKKAKISSILFLSFLYGKNSFGFRNFPLFPQLLPRLNPAAAHERDE